MATLTGQSIASSYEQLLHVDTDGGGNTTTLVPVKDGDNGTTFALQLSTTTVCIDNPTADSSTQGGLLRLQSDDGALMQSGSRLGVIEFSGAEDSSNTITTGARIEAVTDAAWSASENGAYMSFYTTDGNASQSEKMRIDASGNVGIGDISMTKKLEVASDTDVGAIIGKAHIGFDGANCGRAMFSHVDQISTTGFVLAADPNGGCYVNAKTGQSIGFYINGSAYKRMQIDNNSRISLSNNDSGSQNTVFGYDAGNLIDSNDAYNTFIGYQVADADMTTATYNTAVGWKCLTALTLGDNNSVFGAGAGLALDDGGGNTLLGTSAGTLVEGGANNVIIGLDAGRAIVDQGSCVIIGADAGKAINNDTANGSVCVGYQAGMAITSGQRNVALGFNAGLETTVGDANIAIGYQALVGDGAFQNDSNIAIGSSHPTGPVLGAMGGQWATAASTDNIAIGTGSMSGAMNAASKNVAVGSLSLQDLTEGVNNTAVGSSAGANIVDGGNNVSVGFEAGAGIVAHLNNTYLGSKAGQSSVGAGCVAVGYQALKSGHDKAGTVMIGYQAGAALEGGDHNIGIGSGALSTHVDGNRNLAIGYGAMAITTGGTADGSNDNIFIGQLSGGGDWADLASNQNVALGGYTLSAILSGALSNVAIGYNAMKDLTTADKNVAIGAYAGENITSGHSNTLIGYSSGMVVGGGLGLTTSGFNTAVGYEALGASSADAITVDGYNTCVGYQSGYQLQNNGTFNTLVGYNSGIDMTTGDSNVAIGVNALANNTSGETNIAMGRNAGDLITTGFSNTLIGHEADVDANSDSYQVKIGHYGVKKYKTARITLNGYSSGFGTDDRASSTALFSVPIYSHVSKVWCKVITLSQGTAVYSISMGTASDEAVGDVIAGRIELLGADDGTGCVTRSQDTQNADSNIVATAGEDVGMVWVSNINVETTDSDGWCDAAMYFYVSCAGTGNNQSDPGTDAVLDIGVEYY